VTVGTDHHPFDRLVEWVAAWQAGTGFPPDSILVQSGTSRPPKDVPSVDYLAHTELERLMTVAACVVCHGGPSTILGSLASGKKPIVVPRRSSLGEHVDDHQVRFTRRLGQQGYVLLAEDRNRFDALLTKAVAGSPDFEAPAVTDRTSGSVAAFGRLISDRLGISGPSGSPAP
jgi:UDP-N-acetylglucosamine transferase subunit ALG13